jgi:hypothetical protein
LLRLSKKAVSYSSASMTKWPIRAPALGRAPSRAETPKFSGTPPIRKPGCRPGLLQHPGQHRRGGGLAVGAGHGQHMAALQHVLGQPLRAAGVGAPALSMASISGLPRDTTLPITKTGRAQRQLVGAEALDQSMPSARSWSLIGG